MPRSSLDSALSSDLAALRDRDLERRLRTIHSRDGAVVVTEGRAAVDFSANDYLGLATDPRLAAAARAAMSVAGTGATASRLIAGNSIEHEQLDTELAAFLGTESALSFSTGYAANAGAIPALVGRGDVIFADELNHASLIDGCRLSRAMVHVVPHANVDALRDALAGERRKHRRALIVTDGMFSMDGDFAPLADIVALAHEHDAWTYVDDAHALGVTGDGGRGSAEAQGVLRDIDVLAGTLGKAFGAAGAFVAGSSLLRAWLMNRARSFVFSTAPMPVQAAAAREGVRIASSDAALRARVASNARRLRGSLASAGIEVVGEADAHIIPIVIGPAARTMEVGAALASRGFLVGAVRPPTVPDGTSRLRLTVSAAHTPEQIDALVTSTVEVVA